MPSPNSSRPPRVRNFFLVATALGLAGAALVWQWPFEPAPAAPPIPTKDNAAAVAEPASPSAAASASVATAAPVPLDPTAATLRFAGRQVAVRATARGEFSRVLVAPSTLVVVDLPFPGAVPGEVLPIQAEDGGTLVAGVNVGQTTVGDDGRARFEFRSAPHDGLNRVTLRRGGESRVLEFWVGPEAPVLVRR